MVTASGSLRNIVQDQQVAVLTRRNGVSTPLIVTELDQQRRVVQLLNHGANLPARKSLGGNVRQQCHHIKQRWFFIPHVTICRHHSTQHVTNRGRSSPRTALLRWRLMVTSSRQWVPQASFATGSAKPRAAAA